MDQPVIAPPVKKPRFPNLFKSISENPVILKELRGRMRGRRAFLSITFYLILISVFIGLIYLALSTQGSVARWDPQFRQNVGKVIFSSVILFEFLMISFIGPALTAGAITSERERQTFDLLRTTLLSARALVFGKLGSACAYLFLLIFMALPIEALAFLLGGVGIEELLVSGLILVVNVVFFCALGLLCSSIVQRTLTATVLSYTTILLSILALGLISFVVTFYAVSVSASSGSPSPIMLNVLAVFLWLMASTNSFTAGIVSEIFLIQNQSLFIVNIPLPNGTAYLLSPWILHVVGYMLLAALMILLTILFVRRPDR